MNSYAKSNISTRPHTCMHVNSYIYRQPLICIFTLDRITNTYKCILHIYSYILMWSYTSRSYYNLQIHVLSYIFRNSVCI